MEINKIKNSIFDLFKKYKFIALIILIGIALLLIPSKHENNQETNTNPDIKIAKYEDMENRLAELLQNIKGAGKVKVMLTVAQGEEIIYQTNTNLSSDNDSVKEDSDTVTITDSGRNQSGLVRQANPPTYLGAIIVCQGADDPIVKLSITEAVSKITGLKSNCISVLKMK